MTQAAESLLDDVYHRVLHGDFSALPALLPGLEAGLADLSADDPAGLHRIKEKAARNAACLDAALSGFRAARRRLADISTAEQGLATYDSNGAKRLIAPTGGGMHRF